ncbi:MAG: hypothetical protein QW757_04320 [Candidatus Woesearchaeota archaeon]
MAKSEMQKKSKSVGKIKKKSWIKIFSPKNMGSVEIGETYVEDPNSCIGRTVKVNLMQLTGDIKSQTVDVKFEIINANENKLETRIIGYYFSQSTIKRLVRRNMSRIDDSIVVRTKDDKLLRVKPLALTRSKVSKMIQYSIRMLLRTELINFVSKNDYETVFSSVVKYNLQKELRDKLNKIYPLKNLEIRVLEEEKNKTVKETEMPKKRSELKAKKKKENEEEIKEESKEENKEDNKEKPEDNKKEN